MTKLEEVILRDTRANQPAAGVAGRLYYVTDESVLERDSGSAWQSVSTDGFANPMTTAGDIIKGGSSGTPQRLAIGSSGQVLTVSSGAPAWVTPAGVSDGDKGDVVVSSSGSVWTVEGLQGDPVVNGAPFLADVLTWNGSAWENGPGRTYSGSRATRSTNQSINDATDTAINFNSGGGYDDAWSGSIHSTSTNNERFTIPADEDGRWIVIANVTFAANATGFRRVDIVHNDGATATVIARANAIAISGEPVSVSVSMEYNPLASEWFEIHVYQNSGGALNIVAASRYSPVCVVRRVN